MIHFVNTDRLPFYLWKKDDASLSSTKRLQVFLYLKKNVRIKIEKRESSKCNKLIN